MRVTSVSLRSTESADAAGRPSLTPELLAASGARYSRNNEGLDAILSRIDPANLDRSVDSIFKMVDYGHQSIADMVPVAMFIDGISIFQAYLIWSWCPTAGGQESSTRYIKLDRSGIVEPALFGIPDDRCDDWRSFIDDCFNAYGSALAFWERVGSDAPELARIPSTLLCDTSEKAKMQVARMKRNFAFDRARYFLPVAALTNMMLIMSARGWVQLCQNLLSHWLPEANALGAKIREELSLSAPRLIKHAERNGSFVLGHEDELDAVALAAQSMEVPVGEAPCLPDVTVCLPAGVSETSLVTALRRHGNRYDFVGSAACRTSVRFGWSAVAIAEIRDLNRHRTGQKYCPLLPQGFYCARDQMPPSETKEYKHDMLGQTSLEKAHGCIVRNDRSFAAWLLLGTQLRFEHTTTLDKFVYEAELRTGPGAHFRYASHLRGAVAALGQDYPALANRIDVGSNEPEL
jgi:thymidylate synthase ThyX